jgi:aminoglycoside phosphotransferase (APT) family kinase protein
MPQTILERKDALEAFLSGQLQALARIVQARRLTGGASRETWALDVETDAPPPPPPPPPAPPEPAADPATASSEEIVDLAVMMKTATESSSPEPKPAEAEPEATLAEEVVPEKPPERIILPLILRMDMGGEIYPEALSRAQEFDLLQIVHQSGVLVPQPRWLCTDPSVLGAPFFVMDRLEGESVGRRIVKDPALAEARKLLPRQMGQQLARIHSIDPFQEALMFLPRPRPEQPSAQMALEVSSRQLWEIDEPHPVLEWTIRWLDKHQPKTIRLAVLHGDYRIGNLMVGPDGLRGIFDWEFAHLGDPAEELAWPCVRSWRYGQDQLRLGGIGDPEEFFAAYEATRETKIDRNAVRYWEIMGNFRWAVGCIVQAERHLSGKAQNLELASLGRRTCEMELELLDLIAREL